MWPSILLFLLKSWVCILTRFSDPYCQQLVFAVDFEVVEFSGKRIISLWIKWIEDWVLCPLLVCIPFFWCWASLFSSREPKLPLWLVSGHALKGWVWRAGTWLTLNKCVTFSLLFWRYLSLTSFSYPFTLMVFLFGEEDWPWANIVANLPLFAWGRLSLR